MNTTFLLVLLTLGDGGQINAAFVNTDSLNTCQNKSKMLGAVISTSGTKIVENRCFVSDLNFTKFSHGQSDEEVRYDYAILLSDDYVEVIQSKNKMECTVNEENMALTNKGEVYCTTSSQNIKEIKNNA
ncbi:MAG: hypothetical protein PSN44_01660 [Gammaproteobacteria bacterium]|nr:hypothetical protein [Gammaproteobacteria bacterium]